jgi:hypothetical protein
MNMLDSDTWGTENPGLGIFVCLPWQEDLVILAALVTQL